MSTRTILLLAATGLFMACSGPAQPQAAQAPSTDLSGLLTPEDAASVLGRPAHLANQSGAHEGAVVRYQCVYEAGEEEADTHKRGALYFLVEEYDDPSAAQAKYSSIKNANADHEGVKVLDDLGDEAYFHSDGENFYFIMVRKGARVFNMKVNKMTSTTSLDAFNATARKITAAL